MPSPRLGVPQGDDTNIVGPNHEIIVHQGKDLSSVQEAFKAKQDKEFRFSLISNQELSSYGKTTQVEWKDLA